MPPFREKEALPVVLDEVVLCSECLRKCVFMFGKVGQGKPQITKQDFLGAKRCKICEANDMLLDTFSWAE